MRPLFISIGMMSISLAAPQGVARATQTSVDADAPTSSKETKPRDTPLSLHSSTLTGNWGGMRSRLADRGISLNLYLNDQYQAMTSGGGNSNRHGRNSASLEAFVSVDLGKLGVIPQGEFLLQAQGNWGSGVNLLTGTLQQVNDDADGDLDFHVAQLWYRQHLFAKKISLTVGYLDFQTIVDRNAFANSEDKQFWNQALDNNPLVPLNIGLGASLSVQPTSWYSLTMGAGDAQSILYKPGFSTAFHDEDWFLGYLENAWRLSLPTDRGELIGNYRLGFVYDPRPRSVFQRNKRDQRTQDGDTGVYLSVDQLILRESRYDEQGLGVFGRYGYRDGQTNTMDRFWSLGAQYQGLIPGRDNDVLGFGFAQQHASQTYRDRVDESFHRETIYEGYYAIQLTKWLVVTPDLQYVLHPGGDDDQDSLILAGIRVRASL